MGQVDPKKGDAQRRHRLSREGVLRAAVQLADQEGRRDAGRPVAELARAIGDEGREVLEKLATARTRSTLAQTILPAAPKTM